MLGTIFAEGNHQVVAIHFFTIPRDGSNKLFDENWQLRVK